MTELCDFRVNYPFRWKVIGKLWSTWSHLSLSVWGLLTGAVVCVWGDCWKRRQNVSVCRAVGINRGLMWPSLTTIMGTLQFPPPLHPEEQTSTALEYSQNEHLRIQKILPKWVDVTPQQSPTFVGKVFLLLSTHKIVSGTQIWLRAGKTNASANMMLFDCTEGREPTLAN